MNTPLPAWQKIIEDELAIYLLAERPDWFVAAGPCAEQVDRLLAGEQAHGLAQQRLVQQLHRPPAPAYLGRAQHLQLKGLRECWFHITNTCNLSCGHCLFAASPQARESLDPDLLRRAIQQAAELGCRLFYFTGGEPFVYPGFLAVVEQILADQANHVVVLSNGLLFEKYQQQLAGLDPQRFHLQVSVDGLQQSHEELRGAGTFDRLMKNLELVHGLGLATTLSTAVCRQNIDDLAELVRLAASQGCDNVHFLWHFQRGKGCTEQHVPASEIFAKLVAAQSVAEEVGVSIDNIDTLRAQIFATPGTRFDLSNTAWESLAVGPDGHVYPSPALVGVAELDCGSLEQGLAQLWQQSPVLAKIRQASLVGSSYEQNPWRFLVGGGDIDHSYLAGGEFSGHDPYVELYNKLASWLIASQAKQYPLHNDELLLKMGDVRLDCPDGQAVTMTHCNCVVALADGRGSVREFYGQAALAANEDIVNPFADGQAEADFIPAQSRQRSYGCGSPVQDAAPQAGETLVDLGSGSGVECFMAAAEVGESGQVYGIDMTDEMLTLARSSQSEVRQRLGFDNVQFKRGFLEEIPLTEGTVDVVISNCVINLSTDKRRVFLEVARILKPGGRLVVSDIVTDELIPVEIKNDEQFRGECLGGAMQQEELLAMLRATGFSSIELVKRFPYRQEGDTQFYSLTFRAWKPLASQDDQLVEVIYPGPFATVTTEEGLTLFKGRRQQVRAAQAAALGDTVFVVDETGAVTNMSMVNSCCAPQEVPLGCAPQPLDSLAGENCGCDCETAPEAGGPEPAQRRRQDCMVCGAPLVYRTSSMEASCHYCGQLGSTNASCEEGHFVCDQCHQAEGLAVIRQTCLQTMEEDMVALLQEIRQHPALNMHGPEHHALLPGVILATARKRGMALTDADILSGIERGAKVPGGACGFMGCCGAATGVGIAMAVLFDATPITPFARQQAQAATARVLSRLAELKAGRCCQRETWLALQEVAALSRELALPVELLAQAPLHCSQYVHNKECVRKQCPLWESRQRKVSPLQTLPMM